MINSSDFYDFLEDNRLSIEEYIHRLENEPGSVTNKQLITELFQNISKKAKEHEMFDVESFSMALATVCSAIDNKNYAFITLLSDVILLSVDHLYDFTKNLIEPIPNFDQNQTALIQASLIELSEAEYTKLEEYAQKTLNVLTSQLLITDAATPNTLAAASEPSQNKAEFAQKLADHTVKTEQDLLFFKTLISELEFRFPTLDKRGERIIPIALGMNALADNPVNPLQLEAAIYLHDVGMAFIPDVILLKKEVLIPQEREILERHPSVMANLLTRLGDWEEAAEMVLQHHEKVDGSGYPNGLTSDKICDGAKILAILDAFDAMTHIRSDRPFKKTILRAVNEIFKNTSQFDMNWVKNFIQVVKQHYID